MKLSPESQEYADSYAFKKSREIYEEGRQRLDKRKFVSFQETEQADFIIRVEVAAKMIQVRFESYLLAYEKEDKLIDEEDLNEILDNANKIIEREAAHMLVASGGTITMLRSQWSKEHSTQMKEYFISKVRHLMEPSLNDFMLKIREMKLNKNFPQKRNDANNVHIEKLYGNFQQGVINNYMNKDSVLEKDRKRYEVLRWIYDEFNRTGRPYISLDTLIPNVDSNEKRVKEAELIEISDYLSGENLIEQMDDRGLRVKLKHQGIKEVESSIKNPQTSTEHFSVPVIQNFNTFNSPVGAFQQGDHNVANVQQNFGSKTEEIINLLGELRKHISEESKQDGLDYIDGIEAEVTSKKPSESRIKLFLNGLGGTVKDTGKELFIELTKKLIFGEIPL